MSWLKDTQGDLLTGRSFAWLLLLTLAGAFIVSAAGAGVWLTATLVAVLTAVLVHVLLLTPLARDYEAHLKAKPRAATPGTMDALTRMPDHAGRYGDEEFLVVLPNPTLKNATGIAERIRDGVENADCSFNGKKIPVTVSIGASRFHKGEDLERFLARVDKARAAAKGSGRNRVVAERRAAAKGSNRGKAERRTAAAR